MAARQTDRCSEIFLYPVGCCLLTLHICLSLFFPFAIICLPGFTSKPWPSVVYLKFSYIKNCNISAFVPAAYRRDDKAREPRFDKSPFVCNRCCILTQTISHRQTELGICFALPDSKGAEGAHINFISHTNHRFIWRYLFDNAHTAADVVIFWAE